MSDVIVVSVLPPECSSAVSGYNINCMMTIWNQSGCVEEGAEAPNKLSASLQDVLSNTPLVLVLTTWDSLLILL